MNNNVTISWELLDDKPGVIAYLWTQSPFSEKQLTSVGTKKFQTTLSNQTPGTTLTFACKFAFAGGMAVTSYHSYVVGTDCNATSVEKVDNNTAFFYPNPVNERMHLQLEPGDYSAEIYTLAGVKLKEIMLGELREIETGTLPKGIYFIRISNHQTTVHRAIFSKE